MSRIETGLFLDRVPFIKAGTGPRNVVVFFGGNALFRRIDRVNSGKYAWAIGRLLPPRDYTFYILGYESDPPSDYGYDRIVEDFAGVVRERIGGPASVLGISFGGFVALRFAAAHPELVERLVLLVSAHRFSPEGLRRVTRQAEFLRRGDFYALLKENTPLFRRSWYNALILLKLWRDRPRLAAGFNDPSVILRCYDCLFPTADLAGHAAFARRIQSPTLIVGGTADQFFDVEAMRETAELIPDAQLKLFPHETHMLPVERARDVARVIERFLVGQKG